MGRRTSLVRRPTARSRFEGAIKHRRSSPRRSSRSSRRSLIVFSLLRETISFFGDVPIGDFLFGTKWTPLLARRPAVLRRHPAGLGHALPDRHRPARGDPARPAVRRSTSSEYAPPRVRKVVKPVLEVLAGVPTIVFGYFALTFFTPEVLRDALGPRRQPVQRAVGGHHPRPARRCRRSPRWPRTRCRAVPAVAARGRVRARRQQAAGLAARRLPGRALGRRRGARCSAPRAPSARP